MLLGELEAEGSNLSPNLEFIRDILKSSLDLVDEGRTTFLEPLDWISAVADLVAREGEAPESFSEFAGDPMTVDALLSLFVGQAPSPTRDLVEAEIGPSSPLPFEDTQTTEFDTATAESDAAATESETATAESDGGLPLGLLLGAGAALLLVLTAAAFLVRHRPATPAATAPPPPAPVPAAPPHHAATPASSPVAAPAPAKLSLHDLVDASRRMTSSFDIGEIAAIALDEARRLVDAEGGLIVRRVDGHMVVAHQDPPRFFAAENITRGSLERVAETGRSITAVASDEPVLVEVPMAMAAVPIVTEGQVNGALMVVRVASRPFDRSDLDALGDARSVDRVQFQVRWNGQLGHGADGHRATHRTQEPATARTRPRGARGRRERGLCDGRHRSLQELQ